MSNNRAVTLIGKENSFCPIKLALEEFAARYPKNVLKDYDHISVILGYLGLKDNADQRAFGLPQARGGRY